MIDNFQAKNMRKIREETIEYFYGKNYERSVKLCNEFFFCL